MFLVHLGRGSKMDFRIVFTLRLEATLLVVFIYRSLGVQSIRVLILIEDLLVVKPLNFDISLSERDLLLACISMHLAHICILSWMDKRRRVIGICGLREVLDHAFLLDVYFRDRCVFLERRALSSFLVDAVFLVRPLRAVFSELI
jgi:hypothetical protein